MEAAAALIKKRLGARKGEGYYFPLIFFTFALFDARPFRFAKAEFACNRECPSSLLLEGDPSRSIPECPNSTRPHPLTSQRGRAYMTMTCAAVQTDECHFWAKPGSEERSTT